MDRYVLGTAGKGVRAPVPFHFTQMVDDGKGEDDEEDSHDHIPKTVWFNRRSGKRG